MAPADVEVAKQIRKANMLADSLNAFKFQWFIGLSALSCNSTDKQFLQKFS